MSENINSQYDFFKKVNLDTDGNLMVSVIGGGVAKPFAFTSDNYTGLTSLVGMVEGDLAYVVNSQGTQWLPSTLGGSFYPNGVYIYVNNTWASDRNSISYELYLDEYRLTDLENRLELTNGVKGEITVSNLGETWNINTPEATQLEAESGTSTDIKRFTPLRIKQAINSLSITEHRVVSVVSTATLTIDSSITDQSIITAQAQSLTIGAPTGAPSEGRKLIIRIKDNGTNRALSWNSIFEVVGVTLPTTTTANKIIYIGLIYNSVSTKWNVVAVKEQI